MAAALSTREGNLKKLTHKFLQLRSNATKQGLSSKQLRQAIVTNNDERSSQETKTSGGKSEGKASWREKLTAFLRLYKVHVMVVTAAVTVGVLMLTYDLLSEAITETPCLVDANVLTEEISRPKVDCAMCRDVFHVPEERNLSAEDFYQKYAFTGRPVLVKEATANWTAMSHFSFQFLRELYKRTLGSLKTIEEDCQFFPYETEFLTLAEAFTMSEERASFQPGQLPWYIGWSNCHQGVGKKLRKHYERPYFLPADSESVAEDWIFMGGPGPGAMIHLDYVQRPSWQAQISGTKTWQLIPSPECEAVCHAFNVTVQKGDIIVLDTNMWYHSTFVHPGEISITIGSEYD